VELENVKLTLDRFLRPPEDTKVKV